MKFHPFTFIKPDSTQRGAAAVEFAVIAIVFFTLLLGAMEFGRALYLWNTVQEVSRSAARQAVVTNFNDATAIADIKRAAVFRATDGALPAAPEITNATVRITYLSDASGTQASPMPADPADNITACLNATRTNSCIRFVEVSVCTGNPCVPVSYIPMIGFLSQTGLQIPLSTVRMPAESLGFNPS